MRKGLSILLVFLLLLPAVVPGIAESGFEEEEIDIEDLDALPEAVDIGDPLWNFPVALEDLNPEYIILANKHYLLSEDYVPKDLVKVPGDPKNGGIKWASSGQDGKLKGWYLREDCSKALCEMNAAMREQDGFQTMYLKSAYRSLFLEKSICSFLSMASSVPEQSVWMEWSMTRLTGIMG